MHNPEFARTIRAMDRPIVATVWLRATIAAEFARTSGSRRTRWRKQRRERGALAASATNAAEGHTRGAEAALKASVKTQSFLLHGYGFSIPNEYAPDVSSNATIAIHADPPQFTPSGVGPKWTSSNYVSIDADWRRKQKLP